MEITFVLPVDFSYFLDTLFPKALLLSRFLGALAILKEDYMLRASFARRPLESSQRTRATFFLGRAQLDNEFWALSDRQASSATQRGRSKIIGEISHLQVTAAKIICCSLPARLGHGAIMSPAVVESCGHTDFFNVPIHTDTVQSSSDYSTVHAVQMLRCQEFLQRTQVKRST